MKLALAISILSIFVFSNAALAVPSLHDPVPLNNSYISGGSQTFSVNATSSNFNSSSAILYIISLNAYQQGESWDNHSLTCVNTTNEWKCSKSMSFAIAGSDTVELFYFEASDADGTKNNSGNSSNSLRFTLDRNPPAITFVNPVNNSYVNGNETVRLTILDVSSGVNGSTAQYSAEGGWNSLNNISSTSFESVWNTTTLSDNRTINFGVRVYDNVGNIVLSNITVTVDNENPRMAVLSNLSGNLAGNVQLQVNVNDSYSGIDWSNVKYSVSGVTGTLGCTGSNYSANCSAVLNTASLQDGNHTITFTTMDIAGNSNTSSIQIQTLNTNPFISIVEPANNAFVKGSLLVKANIVNTNTVRYVEISVEKGSNKTTNNMTCSSNFTNCTYTIDTTALPEGEHTVKIKAVNSLSLDITSSIKINVDNTKPVVTINQPGAEVKGTFEIKVDVAEGNFDKDKATFNISSFGGGLTCTQQTASTFICSTTFDSKKLSDGKYVLYASAEDKAGNSATATKNISVANAQQTTSSSGNQGASGTPSGEQANGTENEKTVLPASVRSRYAILGIVLATVIVITAIIVLIVVHKSGKTIITEG